MAVPGLCCFAGFSLVAVGWGYSPVAVPGLLIVMASLVTEHALYHTWTSVVVIHGPSCSAACGIFLDQGSNPCLLHWQEDSLPLGHHGRPSI